MTSALNEVKKGKLTIGKISEKFQVSKTTLHNHITGRVIHGTKPGQKSYLQADEEVVLVEHLMSASKVGYGKTRKQVNMIVEPIAKKKGVLRKDKISNGWWGRFIERQPKLSLQRVDSTAHIQMDSINKESIAEYFDFLDYTLKENHLEDCPGQIYNMHMETGMPLGPRPPNIITKSGQKKVNYWQSGKKEQITVIGCGNDVGLSIPPWLLLRKIP